MDTQSPEFVKLVTDIDDALVVLRKKGHLKKAENTIYEFFEINVNHETIDSCVDKIKRKVDDFQCLSNNYANAKYALPAQLLRLLKDPLIKTITTPELKKKYDAYLENKLWEPIESLFIFLTKNKILDLKERADLITQALRLDFNKFEYIDL